MVGKKGKKGPHKDTWEAHATKFGASSKKAQAEFVAWARATLIPQLYEFISYRNLKKKATKGSIQSPAGARVCEEMRKNGRRIIADNPERNTLTEEDIWGRAMYRIRQAIETSADYTGFSGTEEEIYTRYHEFLVFIGLMLNKKRSLDVDGKSDKSHELKKDLMQWQKDHHWNAAANIERDVDPTQRAADYKPETNAPIPPGGSGAETSKPDGLDKNGAQGSDEPPPDRRIIIRAWNPTPSGVREAFIGRDEAIDSIAALQARISAVLRLQGTDRELSTITHLGPPPSRFDSTEAWLAIRGLPDAILTLRVSLQECVVQPRAPPTPEGGNGTGDKYESMDQAELVEACRSHSLSTEGSTRILRQRLRAFEERQSADAAAAATQLEPLDEDLLPNYPPTQILYERTVGEVRRLLKLCKDLQQPGEEVNVRADREADPAVLNREGLAHVEENEDGIAFAEGLDEDALVDYDTMQAYLEDVECQWRSLPDALSFLRSRLGIDEDDFDSIIHRLPPPRSINLSDPSADNLGRQHLMHQICFLAWALTREQDHQGGVCADHMGMGKTQQYISLQVLLDAVRPGDRPTLLVTTNGLKFKAKRDAEELLGEGWVVLEIGQKIGKHGNTVTLDPENPIFKNCKAVLGVEPQRVVIVASYTLLSTLPLKPCMKRFFYRIILDEGHENRRAYLLTARGRVLNYFDAESRWVFTGTPIVNSLIDLCGIAYFLQRPWWSADVDRNQGERYLEWKGVDPDENLPRIDHAELDEWDEVEDWDDDCSSVDGLEDVDITRKAHNEGWLCSHFPAGEELNKRPSSITSNKRLGVRMDGKLAQTRSKKKRKISIKRPFAKNPFNHWHKRNANRRRAFTYEAILYWIISHVRHKDDSDGEPVPNTKITYRTMCFLKSLFISRNAASTIENEDGEDILCGGDIPPMKIMTHVLKFTAEEQKVYEEREKVCGRDFDWDLSDAASADRLTAELMKKAPGKKFRQVYILTTSLLLFALRRLRSTERAQLTNEGFPALMARLWKLPNGFPRAMLATRPWPRTIEELLALGMWGTPKFRWACGEVERVCYSASGLATHRKLITMFHWPQTADMWYKILGFIGVPVTFLRASMSAKERDEALRDFQSSAGPLVLVCTDGLNMAGFDLQDGCCTVIAIEPSFNYATDMQAGTRVHRYGQTAPQQFLRPTVQNTYLDVHQRSTLMKLKGMIDAIGGAEKASAAEHRDVTSTELAERAFGILRTKLRD
ncbi:hypothetical protein LTR27_000616 [Elasticomyces elasticus]|nr:hypothetical protein LTR27_000616 [Elasticomyces elasticus]